MSKVEKGSSIRNRDIYTPSQRNGSTVTRESSERPKNVDRYAPSREVAEKVKEQIEKNPVAAHDIEATKSGRSRSNGSNVGSRSHRNYGQYRNSPALPPPDTRSPQLSNRAGRTEIDRNANPAENITEGIANSLKDTVTGTVDLGTMLITEAGRESLKAGIGYVINNPISAVNSVKESLGKEVTEFKEAPWVGENSRLEKSGYIAGDIAMLLVGNKGIGNAGKAAGISGKGAKGTRSIIRAENIGHKILKSECRRKISLENISKQLSKKTGRAGKKEAKMNIKKSLRKYSEIESLKLSSMNLNIDPKRKVQHVPLPNSVLTNKGRILDITPTSKHSITTEKLPIEGMANSSIDMVNEKGIIIQRRWYDSNGIVFRDVDMTNHGNSKWHPEVPHEHLWSKSNGRLLRSNARRNYEKFNDK